VVLAPEADASEIGTNRTKQAGLMSPRVLRCNR
jgi:hypothetical protein